VHISSRENQSDAPIGKENWFVMVNGTIDYGQNWQIEIEKTRANVLRKLKKHGLDMEKNIEYEQIATPVTIARETGSYRGALYGISSNRLFSAFLRPGATHPKLANLYFCGGTVHPGGGMPLALLSGKIASEKISESFL
jgi:phytoene dehydrogenase-like protein